MPLNNETKPINKSFVLVIQSFTWIVKLLARPHISKSMFGRLGLWHINLCRLFNDKSIFIQIVLFQTIQFSMSTQFSSQKHFYFKLLNLFKQF